MILGVILAANLLIIRVESAAGVNVEVLMLTVALKRSRQGDASNPEGATVSQGVVE